MKKSPEKRGVHSGPKDASSAYLFFIRVRVRVRVRVTKLVYQIGLTTPFYVSRARKYFSSKQQQARSSK